MASVTKVRTPLFWLQGAALLGIVAFGALVRSSGFAKGDPWFDDAWVVLSTKVGLGRAVHMVDTTPLYTLGTRSWILLHPGSLWWAQLPAYVLGLGSIVAVFLLLRFFKLWWPLPFLGALVIAASPVAITYSTRVKQYNFDILAACAVLWLFERWRRSPTRRHALELTAVCVVSLFTSATTSTVIAPVCAIALLAAWSERRRRRDAFTLIGAVVASVAVEYVVWLRHLSHGLHVGWTNRGYLMTFKTTHMFFFALQNMATQFFHWMIDIPSGHPPDPSKQITVAGIVIAFVTVGVLVAVVGPHLYALARRPRQVASALTAPAGAVAFSVLLAVIAISPFGGGRTDEVIYPAVLLLFGAVVTKFQARDVSLMTRLLLAGVVIVAASCLLVGVRNRGHYNTIGLRTLYSKFHPHVEKTDFVVVDPWMTFAWADDNLSPTAVSFAHTYFDWSQGFHVVSLDPHVIISDEYFFPNQWYGVLQYGSHRLWYVGETIASTNKQPAPVDYLVSTRNLHFLRTHGWVPTMTAYRSTHTMALLMLYQPSTAPKG